VTVTADDHQRRRPARAAWRTPERPTAGHPGAARWSFFTWTTFRRAVSRSSIGTPISRLPGREW